jgi:hypothetical protein
MAKIRRVSRKPLYIILTVSLVIALGYAGFNYLYPPQSSQIMEIAPISLTYGNTTITGILQKDSPLNQPGAFILVLPDMRVVFLDAQGIDGLVGKVVGVSGYLTPISEEKDMGMIMLVNTIEPISL